MAAPFLEDHDLDEIIVHMVTIPDLTVSIMAVRKRANLRFSMRYFIDTVFEGIKGFFDLFGILFEATEESIIVFIQMPVLSLQ
jgi:hypothetical protein